VSDIEIHEMDGITCPFSIIDTSSLMMVSLVDRPFRSNHFAIQNPCAVKFLNMNSDVESERGVFDIAP
jgi:hypothetical protein